MPDIPYVDNIGAGFSKVLGLAPLIFIAVIIFGIVGYLIYYMLYRKKFNIQVIIVSKREGTSNKILFDKGAYMIQKDGAEYFMLLKNKVKLQPPSFDYLVPSAGGNVIFLRQISQKDLHPIRQIVEENELKLRGIEPDVSLWGITIMQRNRQMFQKKGFMEQYLSMIIFGVVATFIVVLIYILLKRFDVLQAVAASLKDAAQILAQRATALPPAQAPI